MENHINKLYFIILSLGWKGFVLKTLKINVVKNVAENKPQCAVLNGHLKMFLPKSGGSLAASETET